VSRHVAGLPQGQPELHRQMGERTCNERDSQPVGHQQSEFNRCVRIARRVRSLAFARIAHNRPPAIRLRPAARASGGAAGFPFMWIQAENRHKL